MKICTIEGCDKRARARGWCPMHYRRWLVHGDTGIVKNEYGSSYISEEGYVVLNRLHPNNHTGRKAYEHRMVMEKMLDRSLNEYETVHHKNGDKTDNRPENLELWSHYQPKGQRVEDKLAWAHEIIEMYGKVFKN